MLVPTPKLERDDPRSGIFYKGLSFKRTRKEASISSSSSDGALKDSRKSRTSLRPKRKSARRFLWRKSFTLRSSCISRFYRRNRQPLQKSLSQMSLTLVEETRPRKSKLHFHKTLKELPPIPPPPGLTVNQIEEIVNNIYPVLPNPKPKRPKNPELRRHSPYGPGTNRGNSHIIIPSHQRQHHRSTSSIELPLRYSENNKSVSSIRRQTHSYYTKHGRVLGNSESQSSDQWPTRYPQLLQESWKFLSKSQDTDLVYLAASELANIRLKERAAVSRFETMKSEKRARRLYENSSRVCITAYQDSSTENETYFLYNGLQSMEAVPRISRLNARQRDGILSHRVIPQKTYQSEPTIECHTETSSYKLMRSSCATYMNKAFQGYGTYLPKGQLMANLILLNKQSRSRTSGCDPHIEARAPYQRSFHAY